MKFKNDGDTVYRLSHRQHVEVSIAQIFIRLVALYRSITIKTRDAKTDSTLFDKLDEACQALLTIPQISAEEALKVYSKYFDEEGYLKLLLMDGEITASLTFMKALADTCYSLANRYIYVVRLSPEKTSALNYVYRRKLSVYPDGEFGKKYNPRNWFRELHGLGPTNFRMHIPLAKATSHYEVYVKAHKMYFFDIGNFLANPMKEGENSFHETEKNSGQSRKNYRTLVSGSFEDCSKERIHGYYPEGNGLNDRIYLGLKLEERPNGSHLVALLNTLSGVLLMWVIVMYQNIPSGGNSGAPSLIMAVVSLSYSLSGLFMPARGWVGAPLVPRYAILTAFFLTGLFAVTLLYEPEQQILVPVEAWASGLALCSMSSLIVFFLLFRQILLTTKYACQNGNRLPS